MIVIVLLLISFFTGILAWMVPGQEKKEKINVIGSCILACTGIVLSWQVFSMGTFYAIDRAIYVDPFSALIIIVIVIVNLAVSLYSIPYLKREVSHGLVTREQSEKFYLWYHVFVTTMLSVVVVNNLGLMWVAIEATTLASALLVGFYDHKHSLEAAWKYVILCTVGITFGLFGTIFTYYSAMEILGHGTDALYWTKLMEIAPRLDPSLLKLAFVFILVGYGTKAGLAPLHNWLPDAHSQAPTPISAVLSGVLLNCALYGIIRFYSLTNSALLGEFSQQLLLVFGLVSIGIAVPFIVLQKDIKRLLAYSSVEHMGIIALGVGLGSKLALMGAMFHLFNHAMAKSMFFMAVGNIAQKFNTKNITRIKGIVHVMPATVVFFLIGAFALTGLPPFSIFMSEFTIAWAGFTAGKYMVSSLYLLFIALIFAGLGYHVTNMSFGRLSRRVAKEKENTWLLAAMCIPLLFVIGLGFSTPAFVTDILEQIAVVVGGE